MKIRMSPSLRKRTFFFLFVSIIHYNYAQNLAPLGVDNSYVNLPNQILTVNSVAGLLHNDVDPDGGNIYVNPTPTTPPTSGAVTLNFDGSFSFIPVTGLYAPVTFQYQVCDDGLNSELISQFDFDTSSLTTATVGPNATSINPVTEQAGCGVRTTINGGNIGIDMVIPNTGGIFDFSAFEIEFEYRDQESTADIVGGGNFRIYHISGNNLGIRLNVIDSNTGNSTSYTQNLGAFSAGSNTYVVSYNEASGEIRKTVNGTTTIYPNVVPVFSPLDTTLASQVIVGRFMDGAGRATPSLCSLLIRDRSSLCDTALVTIHTSTTLISNRRITYRVQRNR